MKKVRMRRLVCIKPCRFHHGKFEVHFEFGVKYPIVLKADGHWWLINPAQKKAIMLHPRLITFEKISEFFIRWNPNKRGSKYERWGGWVKCVKTITEIFIEGEFYHVPYRSGTYITIIDELGNGIGFDIIKDQIFKDHFKFVISQKRGTIWATQRQQ